jgi:hypothetical protein
LTASEPGELVARWRRELHAPWETAVADTDQALVTMVRDGVLPPWVVGAWEQWKAAERARKRLDQAHDDGLDELDFPAG